MISVGPISVDDHKHHDHHQHHDHHHHQHDDDIIRRYDHHADYSIADQMDPFWDIFSKHIRQFLVVITDANFCHLPTISVN